MSSIISDSTYQTIKKTSLGGSLVKDAIVWRDQNANVARRITCGLALVAG